MLTLSPRLVRSAIVTATAGLLLASGACSSPEKPESPEGATQLEGADAFPQELKDLCERITERTVDPSANPGMVIVQDGSHSVLATKPPTKYAEQIRALSVADGGLTVVGVNGADVPATTLLLNAALSTPGERDRPSVADLADVMPRCVEYGYRLPFTATGEGTDLHRAMAVAAEVVTAETQLWTFTDMLSNAGPLGLTADVLALEPDVAARRAAAQAPLDLHGATWHVVGVGNTTASSVLPEGRSWLLAFTQELCRDWNAAGCDAIALTPTTESSAARPEAPLDPEPTFPAVTVADTDTGCSFTVPSSVAFLSDSAELLPGAEGALAAPMRLLEAHPDAEALVVGHTASTDLATEGTSGMELSKARAEAVKAVLEKVAPGRVEAKGVGDSEPLGEDLDPVAGEQVEVAAARERRVDITVTGTGCE